MSQAHTDCSIQSKFRVGLSECTIDKMDRANLHVAMFPWFAMGHMTPFFHLSNKFAERGHRVSYLLPSKIQEKFEPFNHHPHLICFVPFVVPHVEGLPIGAQTMVDAPGMSFHLSKAVESMQDQVEVALHNLKPDFVFFDSAWWLPPIARRLGIKSIYFSTCGPSCIAYMTGRKFENGQNCTEEEMMRPPPGFPPSPLQLRLFEARTMHDCIKPDNCPSMQEFLGNTFSQCDAISFRTCREIEAPYSDYVESQYGKPVLQLGPILPKQPTSPLEERWSKWLGGLKVGSVVYCALGSEWILKKDQFQELVLGFELTGLPFFLALKPPAGAATVEEAFPEGFEERIKGRGIVHGGWVQQTLILGHPAVGCFVSHCGFSSMWEALMNECQIVLLPNYSDQFLNTRIMVEDLKVAVEIERRDEDGWFTRESVCKAVKLVMDEESKVAKEVRGNHAKWKKILLSEGLESSYIDSFIKKLQDLLE